MFTVSIHLFWVFSKYQAHNNGFPAPKLPLRMLSNMRDNFGSLDSHLKLKQR